MPGDHFGFKSIEKIFRGNHKNLILNIISNPFLLSLFISLIIIFSLPQIFNKYTAKVAGIDKDIKGQIIYYADLDNNGKSEKIVLETSYADRVCLQVYKNDRLIEQWNLDGKLIEIYTPDTYAPFWSDIDGDGYKELFIFTYKDNEIYLNCITPLKKKILIRNRAIAPLLPVDKRMDCSITPCGYFDTNKDGIKEFYFIIDVGFALQPRKMFAYDIKNDSLFYSGKSCAAIVHMSVSVINTSNDPNFLAATDAVGNYSQKASYSDSSAWLMGFNKNLAFKFDPVKIGHYPSYSDIISFTFANNRYFVVMNIYHGTKDYPSTLTLYDSKLDKIKEKQFDYNAQDWSNVRLYYDSKNKPDYFFLIKENGFVEKLDKDLNVQNKIALPPVRSDYSHIDIDRDGNDELIFQAKDLDNIVICRSDFSDYTIVNCAGAGYVRNCTVKLNGNAPPELFAQFENAQYTIQYGPNPSYYLRYPLYAGIYLCVLLLILLIQKAQKHRVELKYNTERNIAELQMKSIKNQMDPHFTLNIINDIGSLFYKRNRKKADYVFGKYSKLLRTMILNSDKIVTTLAEELDYVKDYLDLEIFRYDDKFSYEVKIEEGVNLSINIPKMLVHTFAENAVKHGLRHLDSDGRLLIRVYSLNGNSNILIKDNGIGREEAKKTEQDNTNKGLCILNQILDLYYGLMNRKINYLIRDIFDDNRTPAGTEVLIEIPND